MNTEKSDLFVKSIVIAVVALVAIAFAWYQWSLADQLEKEDRLIFVGSQYRLAIERYYENSPGPVKQFPRRLENLVSDGRLTPDARYIVELHPDPLGGEHWGLVKNAEGGIIGIHSLSESVPVKVSDFGMGNEQFADRSTHAEWVFKYTPKTTVAENRPTFFKGPDKQPPAVIEKTNLQANLDLERKNAEATQVVAVTLSPMIKPLAGQIDALAIQLGAGVPGIPPLAGETNRHRRVCIVNATRYATSCTHDPNNSTLSDVVRECVVEAQQRYEQCNGADR
jgi:hypothetical protein